MPELPEVETTARALRQRIVGRQIAVVGAIDWPRMLPNASPAELADGLVGRTVADVGRRGKYVLIRLDDGSTLVIHRKMSGNVLLRDRSAPPDPHTHLVVAFNDGWELRFVDPRKFGRVYLFRRPEDLDAFLEQRLGPEPLDELTPKALRWMLRGRRGRIKPLLLNQTFLAGLGNLYADEALWAARIHPLRAADSLTPTEVARLAAAIRAVLESAIGLGGTSFDAMYRTVDDQPGNGQEGLRAYGRGPQRGRPAQPCPRCGTPMARLTVGQRSAHYCPRCQKEKPLGRDRLSRGRGRPQAG